MATESTALISVAEAARRLACSRGHIYNLAAAKHFRLVDVGIGRTKTRLYAEDLEAYIAKQTRTAS